RPERRFRPSGRIFHEKSGLAAFFRPYRVTAARASERFGCRYDPFATAVLPVFIRVRDLGLLDTYWGVILPQVAFNLGFSVVILQGFFAELPKELFEAAFVDGCSYTRIFWQITLPLSRPVLATVGVLSLVGSWNEFLLPLVMINDDSLYPWPLGIMQYQGQYGTDWGKVLAFVTLTLAPALIFYLMAQKHIIAGLTSGAVKG